eukprot:UN07095
MIYGQGTVHKSRDAIFYNFLARHPITPRETSHDVDFVNKFLIKTFVEECFSKISLTP